MLVVEEEVQSNCFHANEAGRSVNGVWLMNCSLSGKLLCFGLAFVGYFETPKDCSRLASKRTTRICSKQFYKRAYWCEELVWI